MKNTSPTTSRNHKHHTAHAYPFATTPRFPPPNPPCPQAFYSYESQLSHRKTGIGYGKKTDFQKLLPNNPASNRYKIRSVFEGEGRRGVSFGCSRQKSPDRSYLVGQMCGVPGPGNYENQVKTRMSQEYSLRSKTLDVIDKSKTGNYTPGPGAYQSVDFYNPTNIRLSKYSHNLATLDIHTQRFPSIKNSPGPGEYYNDGGNIAVGKYTLSRHAAKGGRVFSREARFTGEHWRASDTPGPANYLVPSEFGEVDSFFE